MSKRKQVPGDYKPDTLRACVTCGKKIYRWVIYDTNGQWHSVTPWKHLGTADTHCHPETATPA